MNLAFGALFASLLVIAAGVIGWQYRQNLDYKGIRVSGNSVVADEAVGELVSIPSSAQLYAINIDSVQAHIETDLWISSANVRRSPTGWINVKVVERTPVALVIAGGVPSHYVDVSGFRMPLLKGFAADVPVLTGKVRFVGGSGVHSRIADPSVREMLDALVRLDSRTRSLVSEIEVSGQGSITVRTTPVDGRGSIPVSLGRKDYELKLVRLGAFWEQVLLKKPDETIRAIDLRYDNLLSTT